jgi:hypothetical protein
MCRRERRRGLHVMMASGTSRTSSSRQLVDPQSVSGSLVGAQRLHHRQIPEP